MHYHKFLFYFFLVTFYNVSYSQTPDGIITSEGNSYNITLCAGDSVTFTLDPFTVAPTVGEDYVFYRVRSGVGTETVQFQGASNTLTSIASATGLNGLMNGDKIYGQRINYNLSPNVRTFSEMITIIILGSSGSTSIDGGVIDQSDQLICSGETPFDLTVSGTSSGTGFNYQWQSSTDNISWTDLISATHEILVMSPVVTTTFFRRRVESALGGSCVKYSSSHRVSVSDLNPGALDVSQSTTICSNTSPGIISSGLGGSDASSSSGTISYQWQQNTGSGWSAITSATSRSYLPPPLTVSTSFRRLAKNTTTISSSCLLASNAVTITLSSDILTLSSSVSSDTFCSGDSVTFTASGSLNYEFLINGVTVQGPSTVNTYTTNFTASSSVTVIGSGTCSETVTLSVFLNAVDAGTISSTNEICYGDPITLSSVINGSVGGVSLPGLGAGNYQWQSSINNINWTDVPSATSANYTIPSLIQSTYFRRNTVNVLNGVLCSDPSNWVYVTVAPFLTGGTIDQADQIICSGDPLLNLTISGGSSGATISYQWQQSTDGGIVYTDLLYETNPNLTPTGVTTTTRFRRKVISSVGSCTEVSNDHLVTINDIEPGSLDAAQSISICYNSIPPTISNGLSGADATSGVGTVTYQWQQTTDNVNWTNLNSGTLSYFIPTDIVTQTTWFRRVGLASVGSLTCSATTNSIEFIVRDEIIPGFVNGDQIICEGDLPLSLDLTGVSDYTGLSHQWQISNDNITFNNITNTVSTLLFSRVTPWTPGATSYYRVLTTNVFGCTVTSTVAKITVIEKPTITQTSAPNSQQYVCPGSSIVSTSFEFGGSATGIVISGLAGSGLSFTGPIGNVYTLSGIPLSDVTLRLTASGESPCTSTSLQYNVLLSGPSMTPTVIRKGFDSSSQSVFKQSGVWFNNTVCESTIPSTTSFFVCENVFYTTPPTYEWGLTPGAAGTINSLGEVNWNLGYTGTVTISVRSISCAGDSPWLHTPIEVVPSSTIASQLTTPSVLSSYVCGLATTDIPNCQITSTTSNTRFYSTSLSGVSDYESIKWSIENIFPGGGIGAVTNPGTINTSSGEMNWNTGFWGSLDIVATPVNCDGTDGSASRLTINLTQADNTTPNILTVSPTTIPMCPPSPGDVTRFQSSIPVNWSISNTSSASIISIDDYTGELSLFPGFSGIIEITATAKGSCNIGESTLRIDVPAAATIQTPLGLDDITICQGTFLNAVEYEIGGFPTSANVIDLPDGVTGVFSATHHIADILYSGTGSNGEVYALEILGQTYTYTVSGSITADQLVYGLANEVSTFPGARFLATRVAPNTLRLSSKVAGFRLAGTVFYINGSILVSNITTIEAPKRTITLTGTVTADPGIYDYTITTDGGGVNCNNISRVGRITVTGQSNIILGVGSDDAQEICFGDPINTITYPINYANFALATGLPAGVTQTYSPTTGLIITGTPTDIVTVTTMYTYSVQTQFNVNGCTPEATVSGTITVRPPQMISLTSGAGSNQQTICSSGSISPITYQLAGGSQGYTISGLPPGIGSVIDPTTRIISITGSPTVLLASATTYSYSITTSGTCAIQSLNGQITIEASPSIRLVSAAGTDNQVGSNGVCVENLITPIQFRIENASTATVTGLPTGLSLSQSGNLITLSGAPNLTISNTTRFTYVVSTNGANCTPRATYSGLIDVIPMPFVDEVFINSNDITNVSCQGLKDGSIIIPSVSPDFDLRIKGGQSPVAQKNEIDLLNQPNLGDLYSITIDGIEYDHTVVASVFGGPTQTPAQVAQELINEINLANGVSESKVTANFDNPSGIELVADTAGLAFTVSVSITTSYSGISTPTITTSNTVSNVATSYVYLWTGPNGFTSSNLSISNLEAGDYSLNVSIGGCSNSSSVVSFTITEPDPITIGVSLCNGAFTATVSGGVLPYEIRLYDNASNLLSTNNTTSIQNYTGLTAGANYRIEVEDSACSIMAQLPVLIPFNLSYDPTVPLIVDDFCNDGNGSGFIELGGNSGGDAFSGGSNQFSYSWTGGPSGNFRASTRDIYNLEAGNYTVQVTDIALGCSDTRIFTVNSVDQLVISTVSGTILNSNGDIDLKCNGDRTALIEINVTGGSGNYSYAWTRDGISIPGETDSKLQNIGVGVYEVTVRDTPPVIIGANIPACEIRETFTVLEPDELTLMINSGTTTSTFCPDNAGSASFDLQILGGTAPYDVTITAEDGTLKTETITNNALQTITGLNPSANGDVYSITVEDANSCNLGTTSTTLTFQSIEEISIDVNIQQIDCENGILGSIELEVSAGNIADPSDVQIQWLSADSRLFHTWATNNGKLENISTGSTYNVVVSQHGCVLFEAQNIEISDIDSTQLSVNVIREDTASCDTLGLLELSLSGGVPPYQIQWELFTSSVSSSLISSTTVTSTSVTPTTITPTTLLVTETVNKWERVTRLDNNAIASDLEPGVYRAIVMDDSNNVYNNCSGTWISRNFNVGSQRFEIINFNSKIDESSCDEASVNAEINFGILNTIPNPNNNELNLKITLDGTDISGAVIKNRNQYRYSGITSGDHTLLVEPISSNVTPTTSSSGCSAVQAFTIEELTAITFEGQTEFELGVCEEFMELKIDHLSVQGGLPFVLDGIFTYDYQWDYTPAETINRGEQTYFGPFIQEAYPGTYELTILDSRSNCSGINHTITVSAVENSSPFSVVGTLQQLISSSSVSETIFQTVKAVSPNCESAEDNGRIGIEISGGIRPYEVKWFKEEISIDETVELIELTNTRNTTQLYNLSPGKYKIEISSEGADTCKEISGLNLNNFYEEFITVPKNEELYIVDGPHIDNDLCVGLPGRLYIEIFNNHQEGITFYYNNKIVNLAEDQPSPEGAFILLIDEPVSEANLLITNSEGCSISSEVLITEIGIPDFEFTSPSYGFEGTILAQEEVTFINTSELPFSYSEWNFGDGSPKESVLNNRTVSSTIHEYGISGTYFVTLRNYNELGCFEEIIKRIIIGRGYNVLVPNVFSPNNDGINDYFRPLFSGFKKVTFRIYDDRGNFLFEEEAQEDDPTSLSGIQLEGWSGDNDVGSPYYIYQFTGTLISDESVVERTGTFVLIR